MPGEPGSVARQHPPHFRGTQPLPHTDWRIMFQLKSRLTCTESLKSGRICSKASRRFSSALPRFPRYMSVRFKCFFVEMFVRMSTPCIFARKLSTRNPRPPINVLVSTPLISEILYPFLTLADGFFSTQKVDGFAPNPQEVDEFVPKPEGVSQQHHPAFRVTCPYGASGLCLEIRSNAYTLHRHTSTLYVKPEATNKTETLNQVTPLWRASYLL